MAGHSRISWNRVAGRSAGSDDGRTLPHFDDCRHAQGGAAPAAEGDFRFCRRCGRRRTGQGAQHRCAEQRPGDAELSGRYRRAQPEEGAVRADLGPPRRHRADRHEQPGLAGCRPVPGARRPGRQCAIYPEHRGNHLDRGYRQGDGGPFLVPALCPERPRHQPRPDPAGAGGRRAGAGADRRRALSRQARARPAQRIYPAGQDDAENAARRRPAPALGVALPGQSDAAPRHHRRLRPGKGPAPGPSPPSWPRVSGRR